MKKLILILILLASMAAPVQALDLTAHSHLSHLSGDLVQRDRFLLKIPSDQHIRMV